MQRHQFIAITTALLVLGPADVRADANGKAVVKKVACASGAFTSIQKICDLVDKLGASCTITANSCVEASQEVFSGNQIELASPSNVKAWNGMGGLGQSYGIATSCLMRDLSDFDGKKLTTQATASTFLGDVTSHQEVHFSSFNKASGAFEGYHRLQACGPAVGCLDAYTQKFRLTPVSSDVTGLNKKAGLYQIQKAYALELWAEGLTQGISVALPGIQVPTPVGDVSVQPQFRFSRATGFVTSPFDGNYRSSFPDSGIALASNQMFDLYGRNPGTSGTSLSPIDPGGPHSTWAYHPKGWISQLALGSRDADPTSPAWKPPAGVTFPSRPDLDVTQARSSEEKAENAYLGASIKASYSIVDLIPKAILEIGCGGIVALCLDEADVFAEPSLDVGFMSQLSFFHSEQSAWNGKTLPSTTVPVPDLRPQNLDQAKELDIRMDSSTAAKFSLNAGMDLKITLSIDTFFTSIHKDLVDVHPRTTIASTVSKGNSGDTKAADVRSYASRILTEKKLFQSYTTLAGSDLATGAADGGLNHIKACLAKPSETVPAPPAPTYTPGDVTVLLDGTLYPCNICIAWDQVDYLDQAGKKRSIPGLVQVLFPASEANKPPADRWKCVNQLESGCYDLCSMDKSGKLKVVETALEQIAQGQVKGMPGTCSRGQ